MTFAQADYLREWDAAAAIQRSRASIGVARIRLALVADFATEFAGRRQTPRFRATADALLDAFGC